MIIIKYEKLTNHSYERNLQYEIYEPINMTRLNLSVCKDIPIDIHIPVILSDELQNLYEDLKNFLATKKTARLDELVKILHK